MSYIKNNFLLTSKTGQMLYEKYAKDMPIFDYHCHLSEKEILEDKPFKDIFEIWLAGDHYKWRLMRNYGIDEEYITGNKSHKEKFIAYCSALEKAFLNPLNHWSQLELKQYFNCDLDINSKNANKIWDHCNKILKTGKITPSSLIIKSKVKYIFTTNEAFDDLSIFPKINKKYKQFKVYPAFRTDKFLGIEQKAYLDHLKKLGNIKTLSDLLKALENRLKGFIKCGCVASDMAVENVYEISNKKDAENAFNKRLKNKSLSDKEVEQFKGYVGYLLFKMYAKYNIRSELHIGAMRNNNDKMFEKLGPDSGFDSIAQNNSIKNLSKLMNKLNNENSLPAMIIFNLNPNMNQEILTLMNCFQDGSKKGKIQYGAAWWFLDNKEGMVTHLKSYTSTGHLDTFIGMLTDSRSFMSYTRHLYFRRILCNFLGKAMERGEMSNNIEIVSKCVQNISYNNAVNYFGLNNK